MPARKMRVELFDSDGNRYSVSFEGQVTREKAIRLLDLVELLGGTPGVSSSYAGGASSSRLSKYDKTVITVQKCFPFAWFSSRDIQSAYEREMKEPISLSTISTYLSRMDDRGLLNKIRSSRSFKYKSISGHAQFTPKQETV